MAEDNKAFVWKQSEYGASDGRRVIEYEPVDSGGGEPPAGFVRFIGVSLIVGQQGQPMGHFHFPIPGAATLHEAFGAWLSAKEVHEATVRKQQAQKIVTAQAPAPGMLPSGLLNERGILMNRQQRRSNGRH